MGRYSNINATFAEVPLDQWADSYDLSCIAVLCLGRLIVEMKRAVFWNLSIWFLILSVFAPQTRAQLIHVSVGSLELPASGFHYLAYGLGLKFDPIAISIGVNHPNNAGGSIQVLGHLGVTYEWSVEKSAFQPFVATGLGITMDHVAPLLGIIPAIVLRGGFRLGGKGFGAQFEMLNYLGINEPSDLFRYVMWPVTVFQVGVYWGG